MPLSHFRVGRLAAILAVAGSPLVSAPASQWAVDPGFAPKVVRQQDVGAALNAVADNEGRFLVFGGRSGSFLTSTDVPTEPFSNHGANLVRMLADGTIDDSFVLELPADAQILPSGDKLPVAVDQEGGLWLSLTYHRWQANEGMASTFEIRRFLPNGRVDTAVPAIAVDRLPSLLPHPSQGVVAWGTFTRVNGAPHLGLVQLLADGTLAPLTPPWTTSEEAPDLVAVQPDGKYLVSKRGNGDSNENRSVQRLDQNGNWDTTFQSPPTSVGTYHDQLLVRGDGGFDLVNDSRIYRFLADGSLDETFSFSLEGSDAIAHATSLADGRLLVDARAAGIKVLSATGSIDVSVDALPGAAVFQRLLTSDSAQTGLLIQAELTTYLYNGFEILNLPGSGPLHPRLTVLSANIPSLRESAARFFHQSTGTVNQLITDEAGRVLVCGEFTHIDGKPRPGMARFLPDGSLDPTFAPSSDLEGIRAFADGTWIARQQSFAPQEGTDVLSNVQRIVRVQSDGEVLPGFIFDDEPLHLNASYVFSRSRWWGQRGDGALLVTCPGLDLAHPDDVAVAWIAPDTGNVLAFLPKTYPLIYLDWSVSESIPGHDPVVAVGLAPTGRVVVITQSSVLHAYPSDETLNATVFAPDGSIDEAQSTAITAQDMNPAWGIAFDTTGRGIAATYDSTASFTHGVLLHPDGGIDAFVNAIYRPRAVSGGGWHDDGHLYNAGGQIDTGFAPILGKTPSHWGYTEAIELGAVLRDASGRLWLGGNFDSIDGTPCSGLVRLHEDSPQLFLSNFSARSRVTTDAAQTLGFVTRGAEEQPLLIRAIGRGIRAVAPDRAYDYLTAPRLRLHDADGTVLADRTAGLGDADMITEAARVGAFPLPAATAEGSDGAGLLADMVGALYSVRVTSADTADGLSLVEVYDRTTGPAITRPLRNVSIRGRTGHGDDMLTGGFVLDGTGSARVLIRGAGPALTNHGVTHVATDPRLKLFAGSLLMAENDDWSDEPELMDAITAAGAFPFEAGSTDAAMVVRLLGGAYTVQLDGSGGNDGEALLEIYLLDPPSVSNN